MHSQAQLAKTKSPIKACTNKEDQEAYQALTLRAKHEIAALSAVQVPKWLTDARQLEVKFDAKNQGTSGFDIVKKQLLKALQADINNALSQAFLSQHELAHGAANNISLLEAYIQSDFCQLPEGLLSEAITTLHYQVNPAAGKKLPPETKDEVPDSLVQKEYEHSILKLRFLHFRQTCLEVDKEELKRTFLQMLKTCNQMLAAYSPEAPIKTVLPVTDATFSYATDSTSWVQLLVNRKAAQAVASVLAEKLIIEKPIEEEVKLATRFNQMEMDVITALQHKLHLRTLEKEQARLLQSLTDLQKQLPAKQTSLTSFSIKNPILKPTAEVKTISRKIELLERSITEQTASNKKLKKRIQTLRTEITSHKRIAMPATEPAPPLALPDEAPAKAETALPTLPQPTIPSMAPDTSDAREATREMKAVDRPASALVFAADISPRLPTLITESKSFQLTCPTQVAALLAPKRAPIGMMAVCIVGSTAQHIATGTGAPQDLDIAWFIHLPESMEGVNWKNPYFNGYDQLVCSSLGLILPHPDQLVATRRYRARDITVQRMYAYANIKNKGDPSTYKIGYKIILHGESATEDMTFDLLIVASSNPLAEQLTTTRKERVITPKAAVFQIQRTEVADAKIYLQGELNYYDPALVALTNPEPDDSNLAYALVCLQGYKGRLDPKFAQKLKEAQENPSESFIAEYNILARKKGLDSYHADHSWQVLGTHPEPTAGSLEGDSLAISLP